MDLSSGARQSTGTGLGDASWGRADESLVGSAFPATCYNAAKQEAGRTGSRERAIAESSARLRMTLVCAADGSLAAIGDIERRQDRRMSACVTAKVAGAPSADVDHLLRRQPSSARYRGTPSG